MEDNKYNEALERAKIELMKDNPYGVSNAIKRIFPEIIESEDERILEWIIGIVNSCKELSFKDKVKLTRYLEKQKEYPTNEEMLRTLQTEYEKGVADTIAKYEQKEQNPTEWSEEDRKMIDHLIEALPMWANGQIAMLPSQADEYVERLKSLQNRGNSPKSNTNSPNEWSEEDEKMKERIITRLNWITHNTRTNGTSPNITFFDEIEWLKSICKQAKQEWSEEDEKVLNSIIAYIETGNIYTTSKVNMKVWLKSLRPQSHWKPSKEQMEALKETIDFTPNTFKPKCTLESLYHDLKKLKNTY